MLRKELAQPGNKASFGVLYHTNGRSFFGVAGTPHTESGISSINFNRLEQT